MLINRIDKALSLINLDMNKFVILLGFLLVTINFCFGQRIDNSPYTRYGIGELYEASSISNRLMGYTSISNFDRYHINITNPAHLASLGATGFEIGTSAKKSNLTEGNTSSSFWSGNIDYFSLGFPLKNPINQVYETKKKPYSLGMAITLNRISRVSYKIASTDSTAEIGEFERSYEGNGGTYQFQWSNAIKYKDLSFGISLGYLFGNINKKKSVNFVDIPYSLNDDISRSIGISGFTATFGANYDFYFNKKEAKENPAIPLKILRVAAIFTPARKFSTNTDELGINTQIVGTGATTTRDTIFNNENVSGKGSLANEIGLGLTFINGEKSSLSVDIKSAAWSSYFNEATSETKGSFNNTLSTSIGGYFRPNYKSYTSFWKRAYYKYGAYYRSEPTVVIGKQVNGYGLTAGIGLPFSYQRKVAHSDIGIEFGNRGGNTIIKEKFFKINFGFTFNDDEWFIKRKYN
jgi:hypothetical protein